MFEFLCSLEQSFQPPVSASHVDPDGFARALSATILLARHGSHDEVGRVLSGRSDIGLNAAGRAEAAALAAMLEGVPIDGIHSSPRRRARETAAMVAELYGLRVESAPATDEIDFGAWTGRPFRELDADPAWARWNTERATAATPGGETMAQAVDRAWAHLADLTGTVLVVSHCDVIRGVVAAALGLSLDRMLGFDCDPGSLTRLVPGGGGFRVASVNERPLPQGVFAKKLRDAYPERGSQPGAAA